MITEGGQLYRNKYRISSTRLVGWDYGLSAHYFVTICIKGRVCFFGEIINKQMKLSPVGQIVYHEIQKTGLMRPDIQLEQFVVMPNHVHLIVHITKDNVQQSIEYKNIFGPQRNNLASIIRGLKGATTSRIKAAYGEGYFSWQSRYHEHIIRDELEFGRIQKYIQENSEKWEEDELFANI